MKTLKEQKLNKCRFFNGTMNNTCEAGVKYEDVCQSRGEGKGFALPCFKEETSLAGKCAKCSFKSEEEVDKEVEECNRHFEMTMKARKAIVEHLGGPWKRGMQGSGGDMVCPCCGKGNLRFTRSGYNGHIHACCSTKGCVSWME